MKHVNLRYLYFLLAAMAACTSPYLVTSDPNIKKAVFKVGDKYQKKLTLQGNGRTLSIEGVYRFRGYGSSDDLALVVDYRDEGDPKAVLKWEDVGIQSDCMDSSYTGRFSRQSTHKAVTIVFYEKLGTPEPGDLYIPDYIKSLLECQRVRLDFSNILGSEAVAEASTDPKMIEKFRRSYTK